MIEGMESVKESTCFIHTHIWTTRNLNQGGQLMHIRVHMLKSFIQADQKRGFKMCGRVYVVVR